MDTLKGKFSCGRSRAVIVYVHSPASACGTSSAAAAVNSPDQSFFPPVAIRYSFRLAPSLIDSAMRIGPAFFTVNVLVSDGFFCDVLSRFDRCGEKPP